LIFYIIQLIIATVLIFVLMFGIGFILNMLIKTTWMPIYLYFIMLIGLIFYSGWAFVFQKLAGFDPYYYFPVLGGLLGAWVSGWSIHTLRARGFKMF
jgi:hypothetical protein